MLHSGDPKESRSSLEQKRDIRQKQRKSKRSMNCIYNDILTLVH